MFNKAWVSNSKSIKTLFGCGLEFESQFHSDGIFDYLSQTQLSVNYLGFGIFGTKWTIHEMVLVQSFALWSLIICIVHFDVI